jgi:hypothetical protein
LALPLPSGMMALPYEFASINYDHHLEAGSLRGEVRAPADQGHFAYRATQTPTPQFKYCDAGSLSEFVMERYSGFFACREEVYVFRAWHPRWLQVPIDLEIEDDSLVKNVFPWFGQASFTGASFAPGFERVALGRAHRLPGVERNHHRLSAFYEMP